MNLVELPSELHLMIAGALDDENDLVTNRSKTTQYALYCVNKYFYKLLDPLFASAALLFAHEDPDKSRHTAKLQELLDRGARVNIKDPRPDNPGCTPLHYAAKTGNLEAVKLLLEHKANINGQFTKEQERFTPLLWAVRKGHIDVAQFLVESGADIELSGCPHDCVTPLRSAVYRKNEPMLKMLLEKGADPNRVHKEEGGIVHPPLFYARPANIMRAMLEGGADVNLKSRSGATALHHFQTHPNLMQADKDAICAVLKEFNAVAIAGNVPQNN